MTDGIEGCGERLACMSIYDMLQHRNHAFEKPHYILMQNKKIVRFCILTFGNPYMRFPHGNRTLESPHHRNALRNKMESYRESRPK